MSVTVVQNESLPFTRVFRTSVIFCRKSSCFCELLKWRAEVKKFFSPSSSLVCDQFIKVD